MKSLEALYSLLIAYKHRTQKEYENTLKEFEEGKTSLPEAYYSYHLGNAKGQIDLIRYILSGAIENMFTPHPYKKMTTEEEIDKIYDEIKTQYENPELLT
jgi:hypothetical protein